MLLLVHSTIMDPVGVDSPRKMTAYRLSQQDYPAQVDDGRYPEQSCCEKSCIGQT
jgi:hypothetical protein